MTHLAALIARGRSRRAQQLGGSIVTGFAGQLAVGTTAILTARVLGPEGRGHVALLIIVALIVTQLVGLGLPIAVTYELARRRVTLVNLSRALSRTVALQLVAILGLHAAVIAIVVTGKSAAVSTAGWLTLAIGPPLLLQLYAQQTLLGMGRYLRFNVMRLTPSIGFVVSISVAVLTGHGELVGIIAAWLVASYSAAIATAAVVWHSQPVVDAEADAPVSSRAMIRFGLAGLAGSASPVETFQLDQAAVGLVLSPVALGLYTVAVAVSNVPRFVAQSIGLVAYADIASRREAEGARRAMFRLVAAGAVVCTAVAGALGALAGPLVNLVFGHAFAGSVTTVRLLLVAAVLMGVRRVLAEGLRGLGRPSAGSYAEAVFWLALIPGILLLLPALGVDGVAAAMALAAAVGLLALLVIAIRIHGRRPARTVPAGLGVPESKLDAS